VLTLIILHILAICLYRVESLMTQISQIHIASVQRSQYPAWLVIMLTSSVYVYEYGAVSACGDLTQVWFVITQLTTPYTHYIIDSSIWLWVVCTFNVLRGALWRSLYTVLKVPLNRKPTKPTSCCQCSVWSIATYNKCSESR